MDANHLSAQTKKPIEEMSEQELLVLLVKDQRKIGELTDKMRRNTSQIFTFMLIMFFLSLIGATLIIS